MTANTTALVLRRDEGVDADGRLLLFTKEFGKVSAAAKGLQRSSSKLAAHLEPLTTTEVFLVRNHRWLVAGSVPTHRYPNVRADLGKLHTAGILTRLIDTALPFEAPDADAYALLQEAFLVLEKEDLQSHQQLLLVHTLSWRLLAHSGYEPQINACIRCNRSPLVAPAMLLPRSGVVCHEVCQTEPSREPHILLSEESWRGLRFLSRLRFVDLSRVTGSDQAFGEMARAVTSLFEERYASHYPGNTFSYA